MSGHSKWAGIKHKKTLIDTKKGKIFNKLIKDIIIAIKKGGAKVDNNASLKKAIANAKEANMPNSNITKAIQRGTHNITSVTEENSKEIIYEGYGPCGIAVIIEVTTDNKNRTSSDLRKVFYKYDGNIGSNGCVVWMFEKSYYVLIKNDILDEDSLINIILENNFDIELTKQYNYYELLTSSNILNQIKNILLINNIKEFHTGIKMTPKMKVPIRYQEDKKLIRNFIYTLKKQEDVKNIYINCDI
ncbi:MAG: YebC/PmpR family DNA-binding transcriptional regulator [Endomicrobium sp.]|jgi:YebC/PmpR family DNA-binding regulatory protein|nr:YebC/PmpR family DNA-binding transcriptional regulator [Endomicrobium sp.]